MKIKKVISILLCFILFISYPISAFASNTEKEEIVYASIDIDGKLKGKYVVNIFDLEKDASILDFGKYEKITNLTNENDIEVNKDENKVEANKGKFFYQGDNPDAELPWIIEIEYFHEGKKIEAQEIAGKEGNVEIKGHIFPNKKANFIFYNYYLGQLSINIDSKSAVVKEAEGSTLAYNGSIQILNYTILPENELEFNIKTDAKSFEMQPLSFSAIPFNMDFDLPDMSEFKSEIGQLENAISMIGDGTTELSKGANLLSDNSLLLYNSLNQIYQGVSQIADGQRELANGSSQFESGLIQYQGGINQLVDKLEGLSTGMNDLQSGLKQLKNGNDEIKEGMIEYTDGIKRYTDGIDELYQGHLKFTDGIEIMGKESNALISGGDQIVEGSNQIKNALSFLNEIDLSEKISLEDLQKLEPIIDKIVTFWNEVQNEIENLSSKDILVSLNTSKEVLEKSISTINHVLDLLEIDDLVTDLKIEDANNNDVVKLINHIEKVNEYLEIAKEDLLNVLELIKLYTENENNFNELLVYIKNYNDELNKKLMPLKEALDNFNSENVYESIKQISNFGKEYDRFHQGLVQYTDGTKQLVNGINSKLLPGSKEIDNGLKQLSENGSLLYDGGVQITDGMGKISLGLQTIIDNLSTGEDTSQIVQLRDGMNMLVDNFSKISSGQAQIADGSYELSTGLLEYRNGFGLFNDGVYEFNDGIKKLAQGSTTLKNETHGMSAMIKEKIDEAMSAFTKEGFEMQSFVSEKNEKIKLVQFVYLSDAITVEKEQQEPIDTQELTFWEKLWDVITFWD